MPSGDMREERGLKKRRNKRHVGKAFLFFFSFFRRKLPKPFNSCGW